MTNRASLTAEYMAFFRALETLQAPSSRLFVDRDAAIFLSGWRRWLYRMASVRPGRHIAESLFDRKSPGARAAGIARTKWIDDQAAAALETATQLVLLGAGFDMRALRLPQAAQADAFELDHPQTSVTKRTILKSVQRAVPKRIRYLEIDFDRQSIAEVLLHAGFDSARPSCWIWEGVTNYLTKEAVDSSLRQMADTSAEGSILLFTYVERAVLNNPESYFGAPKLMARLRFYGEPWTFGLDPREVASYIASRGFRLLNDVSVAEVWQRAGRPVVGTRGYEFYRLASARVGTEKQLRQIAGRRAWMRSRRSAH